MRTVWPALWHQLTVSTQTAYACRRCFQDLDTGSKRLEALSQSISKLEGSFSSSECYPLAVRTTTIFTQPFDSYPKSLAMTLCMRNGSTVSLTQRKLHLRRSHPTHEHVTDMWFAHYYSRICNLIGGRGLPDSAKKTAHSPQTHLPCLIKWRPEVGLGTRLYYLWYNKAPKRRGREGKTWALRCTWVPSLVNQPPREVVWHNCPLI